MIVGISGRIGSGKSTLSRALAARLSAKFVSFGEYVRYMALQQNVAPSDRRALQDLGQSLVIDDVQAFVGGALKWANVHDKDSVVLDGVRHSSVWCAVLSLASARQQTAKLIFLEVPESERQARLASRGLSWNEVSAHDHHESEADVRHRLRDTADICIDAEENEEAVLASVRQLLGNI